LVDVFSAITALATAAVSVIAIVEIRRQADTQKVRQSAANARLSVRAHRLRDDLFALADSAPWNPDGSQSRGGMHTIVDWNRAALEKLTSLERRTASVLSSAAHASPSGRRNVALAHLCVRRALLGISEAFPRGDDYSAGIVHKSQLAYRDLIQASQRLNDAVDPELRALERSLRAALMEAAKQDPLKQQVLTDPEYRSLRRDPEHPERK